MEIALDFVKFVGDSMISPFKGHFIEQDDNVQTRGNSFQTVSTIAPAFGNDKGMINTQELETTKSMHIFNDIIKDKSKDESKDEIKTSINDVQDKGKDKIKTSINDDQDKGEDKIKISMPTTVDKINLNKEEQITNITQGRY